MSGLSYSIVQECKTAMLMKKVDILRLMTYIEQIEEEKISKSKRESKKAHFDEGGSSSTKT